MREQPEATSTFAALRRRGIKVVLNTGYDRTTAEDLIARIGWTIGGNIDSLVTASDVTRNRPAPDMILKAMVWTGISTALMPSALLDAAAALVVNLGMIRRVAEIYGGRASLIGSLGLARRVVAHAMAAGLIEIGGDLLTPLIGGGLATSASRRLGEGVVNGAMTVRIGVAAADLCRPTPYRALPRPTVRALAWRALKGVARAAERSDDASR